MSLVLQGYEGTIYYIDDILVTGTPRKDHEENLRQVFRQLEQYGLWLRMENASSFKKR